MASDLVGSLPVVDLRACAVSEDLLALYTSSMIVRGNSVLRLLHYPPLPTSVPSGAVRAAAHEDINLITLLVEGTSGGLELQRRDGSSMPVASLAGQIVVNVGDMLERVTNGRLRSTTHRVVNPVDAFLTDRLTAIRSQETPSP